MDQTMEIDDNTTGQCQGMQQVGNVLRVISGRENIQGTGVTDDHSRLLNLLGLNQYYPAKLNLEDVMATEIMEDVKLMKLTELPLVLLRKLIMIDFKGRDLVITSNDRGLSSEDSDHNDLFDDIQADFCETPDESTSINPLDIFVLTLNCCSIMLRQVLFEKMFVCKLAVPLIFPRLDGKSLEFSLWAFRTTAIEWLDKNRESVETPVTDFCFQIVSFLRIGEPSLSKSKLLNDVINEKAHHTFFNVDCPNGSVGKTVAGGLIEASWFIPSGQDGDIFPRVTMFANLRGNSSARVKETKVLSRISSATCIILNVEDLKDQSSLKVLDDIFQHCRKIVILLSSKATVPDMDEIKKSLGEFQERVSASKWAKPIVITTFHRGKQKNANELKLSLRKAINSTLLDKTGNSLDNCSNIAREENVFIDEDDINCLQGMSFANDVICHRHVDECKGFLRLQGELWRKWSSLLKQKHRHSGKSDESLSIQDVGMLDVEMNKLRKEQVRIANDPNPFVDTFIDCLLGTQDQTKVVTFFLEWLKVHFNNESRKSLPKLTRKYHQCWQSLKVAKQRRDDTEQEIKRFQMEINQAEKKLDEQSLGLEHLFREIGQLYESAKETKRAITDSLEKKLNSLPNVAAKLMLSGQPMEIMDGDSSNIPITWVKAVMQSIREMLNDKKVFIVSILGVQSSGKSTLLNTMFGLKFAASAGRCTRGVFMQLVKPQKRAILPFDYFLVIDTEGLRAPELGLSRYNNDNELATLAIGLGDVTILNIKGESTAEIRDVLQIVVHAFLRMKIVKKHLSFRQTCLFIHQNVPAVNASEKMMRGCQKLQETLDEMAIEAAEQENISDIRSFSEVINFDGLKHVWYFSDLWHGDPPMAPANPGYSEKAQAVEKFLIDVFAKNQDTYLKISDVSLRIEDLWNGILADDFVFSFRNSLEVKAYNSLESKFFELEWDLEKSVLLWQRRTAEKAISECGSSGDLSKRCADVELELDEAVESKVQEVTEKLDDFFEKSGLKDIMIQWKENKRLSLKYAKDALINKARKHIRQIKEKRRLDLLRRENDDEYKKTVIRKAKELAESIKGEKSSEENQLEIFMTMWNEWKTELTSREPDEDVPIPTVFDSVLLQHLHNEKPILKAELKRNSLSTPLDVPNVEDSFQYGDIEECHISIDRTYKTFWINTQDRKAACIQGTVVLIKEICHSVDVLVSDMTHQDTKFQDVFATEIIDLVLRGFSKHNEKKDKGFTVKYDLRIKVLTHVCRYAIAKFEKMQANYKRKHGYEAQLESFRETIWTLFRNMVAQSEAEVTAAALIGSIIQPLISDEVEKMVSGQITDHFLKEFSYTKYQLIISILDDLTSQPFHAWTAYIYDSKSYAKEWLIKHIDGTVFSTCYDDTGQSMYANIAKSCSQTILQCANEGVKKATQVVNGERNQQMSKWVQAFCDAMQNELAIPVDSLKIINDQKVTDFDNFERLVLKEFDRLEKRIALAFVKISADSVALGANTPYQLVLQKLWGCDAQCPFCHEPCQWRDSNHIKEASGVGKSHTAIQHRPEGVSGVRWDGGSKAGELVLRHCNFNVNQPGETFNCAACEFQCRRSGHCNPRDDSIVNHPQKEYKKFLPDWDIAPNNDLNCVKFWQWFMYNFREELVNHTGAKMPTFPETWQSITRDEAQNSLRIKACE